MGSVILLDTNCAGDYLSNKLPEAANARLDVSRLALSVINRIELLVWPNLLPQEILALEMLIANATVLEITEPVILQTIAIKRQRRIKLPDAIIAATALVHQLPLYTHNMRDFSGIKGLSVVDPYQLKARL